MLKLNDGRSELWQWDTGRKLTVDADCSQIHFSNKIFGRSIDVDVVDGVAIIPDVLLQTDNDLNAWAFVGTAENGYTKIAKEFKINKRNKPSDYVYTPVEQVTLKEVIDRLEELEKGGGGSDESGADGVTFIPSVSSDGVISWTNDGEMPNPTPVNIKGAKGDKGETGAKGDDYMLTAADKQEIAEMAAKLVPSGGGGSGGLLDGCELISSGVLTEDVGINIKKDSNGNDFLLSKVVFILFGEFVQPGSFLAVRIVQENNAWYGTEISPGSSAKGFVMTTEKNGVMSIKVLREDGIGGYWGYGVAEELFHTRLLNTDGTISAEIQNENAKNVYVGNHSGGTKPAAGTIYALYGVRA